MNANEANNNNTSVAKKRVLTINHTNKRCAIVVSMKANLSNEH